MEARPYGMAVELDVSVEEADRRVRSALADEGFGVLTEIDVAATLKKKLGVERAPYLILGACNPELANRALGLDDEVGLLLPCNVVVFEREGRTIVEALDPESMSKVAPDSGLGPIVEEARERLSRALAAVEQA